MQRRIAAGLLCTLAATPLSAQQPLGDLAGRLAAMSAPVGFEAMMADSLARMMRGAMRDRAGNVIVRLGSGSPKRLIACPMDEPGWAVGGIRSDGYLTLRRLPGRTPPMFDQQVEGQRVTVWGARGAVPAVVAVRSTHLTRGRTTEDTPFTSDNAFVDVGARTEEEVRSLGIRVTSPVTAAKRPHRYGRSRLAAPVAGRRAACAALLRASSQGPRGTVLIAFVVEQGLGMRGLFTAVNALGPFDDVVMLEGDTGAEPVGMRRDTVTAGGARLVLDRWRLRTRFGGTPVETVDLGDAEELERRLAAWIGGGR